MGNEGLLGGFGPAVVAITLGVLTVALVAVVLSPQSQASSLITSYTGGLAQMIQAATSPISSNNGSIH